MNDDHIPLVDVEGVLERLADHAKECKGCTDDYLELKARLERAKRQSEALRKAGKVSAAFLQLRITI